MSFSCPVCESTEKELVFVRRDTLSYELLRYIEDYDTRNFLKQINNHVVRCQKCGLLFLEKPLEAEALQKVYSLWYSYGYHALISNEQYLNNRVKEFEEYFYPSLEKYLQQGDRLLDVGCGSGLFLKVVSKNGLQCTGIEFDKHAAQIARKYTNCQIFEGDFQQFRDTNSYNVITMNDYIEHSVNPLRDLLHAYSVLSAGGIIFLRTPNVDSLQRRLMGKNWYGFLCLHLFYFNKLTIKILLEKAGFEVISIQCNNYISFLKFISKTIQYILQRLSRKQSNNEINNRINNDSTPLQKRNIRFIGYVKGLFMELLDIVGGYYNAGNNMTIIARKIK